MNICMISDYYYPNVGGVENHIFFLACQLIERGHRVAVVTHAYPDRGMAPQIVCPRAGLKVYYLDLPVIYNQCTLPNGGVNLPTYRSIFTREHVDVVHGHQAFSAMAHEALMHARNLGLPTVFTDHSLFGFADGSSILTNKILKFSLSTVGAVICVSNTSKENTVLRAALDPACVYVIPNAIVGDSFRPLHGLEKNAKNGGSLEVVTIVVLSRLVYRKGMDLLVGLIPRLCSRFGERVQFVVGGDGPKKVDLEQMREKHRLQHQVQLLGAVRMEDVPQVLNRGQIFLNCSLTEAFCMAIVEAASCGLLVVSTNVGGVPEVLPAEIMRLAEPSEDALFAALGSAIEDVCEGRVDRSHFHDAVRNMYSWRDVACRTERVYERVCREQPMPLLECLRRYYGCGEIVGKYACLLVLLNRWYLGLCDWLWPLDDPSALPSHVPLELI